ncbi:MAG: hypothetical protein GQ534_11065 [Candidatus Delongbacteria bacterium]|nr:hypothetical protein [Candidatus Delongbacteria bacterium]
MPKLKFIPFIILFFVISVFSGSKVDTNNTKITYEKWYDWNGYYWVLKKYIHFGRDIYGNVTGGSTLNNGTSRSLTRYSYSSYYDLKYFSRINYNDSYIIETSVNYRYDNSERFLGYSILEYGIDLGGIGYPTWTIEDHSLNNEYEDDNIIKTVERENLTTEKEFTYNSDNKLIFETKIIIDGNVTTLEERTNWSYKGESALGISETYEGYQWVISGKSQKEFDESGNIILEERFKYLDSEWIPDEKDIYSYTSSPSKDSDLPSLFLTEKQTQKFNESTRTYTNLFKYAIDYDNFVPITTPSNISSATFNDQLTLTWGAVAGATGYKIYSSSDPNENFEIDNSGTFSGSTWTTSTTENIKFYKITAVK